MNIIDLKNSCEYLTTRVSDTMKDMTLEVDILDKQMWTRAALRVWEVFCTNDDCPLTLENFNWVKNRALTAIHEDRTLKNHPECDRICQKVENLFNQTFDPNGSLEEATDCYGSPLLTGDPSGSLEEVTDCYGSPLLTGSNKPKKEVIPSRTAFTLFTQFLEIFKIKGKASDFLPENLLLTYQTFDLIKQSFKEQPQLLEGLDKAFAKVKWQNTLNENNISAFLDLHRNFLIANDSEYEKSCFLTNQWITDENHVFDLSRSHNNEFDYRNLEVTLPLEEITEIYQKHEVIQLRPIDKTATTLIIGCGNGRLSCAGSCSLAFTDERWLIDETIGDYHCRYSVEHLHPGAVTIDPSLASNPTILAYFGNQPISQLFEGQKFDRIIFEGYFDSFPQRFRRSDLLQLLSEDGTIFLDVGHGPTILDDLQKQVIESENPDVSLSL